MDDLQTMFKPLTPEQAAWYAEQEALCREAVKSWKIRVNVLSAIWFFVMCLCLFIAYWLQFHEFGCRLSDLLSNDRMLIETLKIYGGIVVIWFVLILITAIICGIGSLIAGSRLKKMHEERKKRLFPEY